MGGIRAARNVSLTWSVNSETQIFRFFGKHSISNHALPSHPCILGFEPSCAWLVQPTRVCLHSDDPLASSIRSEDYARYIRLVWRGVWNDSFYRYLQVLGRDGLGKRFNCKCVQTHVGERATLTYFPGGKRATFVSIIEICDYFLQVRFTRALARISPRGSKRAFSSRLSKCYSSSSCQAIVMVGKNRSRSSSSRRFSLSSLCTTLCVLRR